MIQNSFIFLERIQKRLEQRIWSQGIPDWDTFLRTDIIFGIRNARKRYYDKKILEARSALYNENSSYFVNILPGTETYRLYDHFKDEAVFLDIETTGLSNYSDVTMVGLYDGIDTKIMVKGINLDPNHLKQELGKYKLILTFNGASFDLPFLEKRFPGIIPNIPHIDLKTVTRRLGFSGGLKKIERDLNITRRKIIEEFNGGDALTLWKMYKATGDDYYLNLLIEYNEEDIINLKTIAECCIGKIKKTLPESKISRTSCRF